ncbi:hypothetical protein SAMN02982927_03006 [Sporolactobacillus nakayamae]|uniref:Uncharacterized protein n=1 Tax=Sporolactobacillus nakayamae TaxID=269670 RepID=A0A1I2V8U1_9BACL|nr:hypothetical protein SAMN02982927_03006 [Sporolactobacillus nakayamae]
MKFIFVSVEFLLNFILGLLFFYVICLWILGIPYTAQDLGLAFVDPNSEKGDGILFLAIALFISLFYFPLLIFANRALYQKIKMKKKYYFLILFFSFLVGFSLITFLQLYSFHYLLFS